MSASRKPLPPIGAEVELVKIPERAAATRLFKAGDRGMVMGYRPSGLAAVAFRPGTIWLARGSYREVEVRS